VPQFHDDSFATLSRKQYWLAILVIMLVMVGLSAWAGWHRGQDEPAVSDADTVSRNDPLTTFMFTPGVCKRGPSCPVERPCPSRLVPETVPRLAAVMRGFPPRRGDAAALIDGFLQGRSGVILGRQLR